jgi:hypothetical protein
MISWSKSVPVRLFPWSAVRWSTLLCAGLVLLAAGCGVKNVNVTGTVLRDKQPIELSPTGALQITLIPDVPPGTPYTTYPGRADATGKFEVLDVPPGKYKIAVEQFDPNPMTDKLQGKFAADKTKIVKEVNGQAPLEVDLATGN